MQSSYLLCLLCALAINGVLLLLMAGVCHSSREQSKGTRRRFRG